MYPSPTDTGDGVGCNRAYGLEVRFHGGDVACHTCVKNEGRFGQGIDGSVSGGVGDRLRRGVDAIK